MNPPVVLHSSFPARLRRSSFAFAIVCSLAVIGAAVFVRSAQAGPAITELTVPGSGFKNPDHIVLGPDSNFWFTERNGIGDASGSPASGGAIGRITPTGVITEFPLTFGPGGSSPFPIGITSGADGNLWFAESGTNRIGRITTSGTITTFSIPTGSSLPTGITSGPDGNLWFTEFNGNKVGRINPSAGNDGAILASIVEFTVTTASSQPREIAAGADGALWFTESGANKIGRITTAGTVTEFALAANSGPYGISSGPDANIWFTEITTNKIGRLNPGGSDAAIQASIVEFATPTANSQPRLITSGVDPDGAGPLLADMWFTESSLANRIGRIATSGTFVGEYPVPTPGSVPCGISKGADNAMWFTEIQASPGNIGRLDLRDPTCGDGSCTTFVVNSTADTGDPTPDGVCDSGGGVCTLREALDEANAAPDLTRIIFAIATGTQTITVGSALPDVKFAAIIDATTQPGYAGSPLIIVSGSSAGSGPSGLVLTGGYTTVRGVAIRNFGSARGIDVKAATGTSTNNSQAVTAATSNNNLVTDCDLSSNNIGLHLQGDNFVDGTTHLIVLRGPNSLTVRSTTITLNGFGIQIDASSNNQIGSAGFGNTISGNSQDGIDVLGFSSGNVIAGNRIGTNAAGTAAFGTAQSRGIQVIGRDTTIGGTTAGERNIISSNSYGVVLGDDSGIGSAGLGHTTVIGNYIGLAADGSTALGNSLYGVVAANSSNTIGGSAAGKGNVISANAIAGITISSPTATANVVQGNFIGTDAAGTAARGNGASSGMGAGILVADSGPDNLIGGTGAGEGNLIAFNLGSGGNAGAGVGVVVFDDFNPGAFGNAIRGNQIHSNAALGIDLGFTALDGPTANDAGDADNYDDFSTGGNDYQNFPVLTSPVAIASNGDVTITGNLNSTPSTSFAIDFFANTAADGVNSEGRTYIGTTNVTTDTNGDAPLNVTLTPAQPVADGSFITATATRTTPTSSNGAQGDTSELSAPVVAQAPPLTVTINQAAGQSDPTNSSSIHFAVVFSESVSDFATGDVTLSGTAGATTGNVTGSGTTYDVAVSGMTGDGTVIATVGAAVAHNGGGSPNQASTSTDNTVTFDATAPTVAINQAAAQSDPTNSTTIHFTVVFSEPVSDFATGDVTLSGTAGATTATVTGSGTDYDVAVTGMTGSGTVIATIAAGVAHDTANNANTSSSSTDNTVTFDNTPPTVTINQAAGQADPTNTSPIHFKVIFSEAVADFATGDVTLSGTAGATTAMVTGGGTTYDVAVSGMASNGTVIASIAAGVAHDAASNSNGASTSTDHSVTFDTTAPTVTINQDAAQADPTNGSPIHFAVIFSEAVTDFATGDVTLGGTAGATTATVNGSGTTYDIAVTGMTATGTVTASIASGVAHDAAGNANAASTSTDNSVTFDTTPAAVTINQAAGQADPTTASPIHFTVLFTESVTDFATGDVTLSGTAGATTATVTGSGKTYDVAVSGMTATGTVIASIASGVAHDAAGNSNTASTSTDHTVTFSPPPASHFVVTAPATATAGSAFNFTVTAQDASNHTATTYAGTAHFTSNDASATLPANSTLTNGIGTFSATLRTVGGQRITATDTVTSSITGTSKTIAVSAPKPTPTATPASTPTPRPKPTATPKPTVTPTATPTATPGATATPTPSPTPTPSGSPSNVLNVSTRERVGTGENVMIGGFIITGNHSKRVIIRGLGPSLQTKGVTDFLADPVLELHGSDGSLIASNDNWKDSQEQEITDSKVPPDDELEAAIIAILSPGAYTAVVSDKNQTSGVALVEVYDLDPVGGAELANISTRGFVQTGADVMIGGFVLGGTKGAANVVLRAIGPSLADRGIVNPLPDPTLELRDENGAKIDANDNWPDDPVQAAQITADGLEPTSPLESAVAATLSPGRYTVVVQGKNGATGVALVEIYSIP